MKKIVFLLAIYLLVGLSVVKADEIIINDVTIPQGGAVDLPVLFNFTSSTDKIGFTFTLNLPSGITTLKDADGDPVFVKDATSIDKLNIQFPGEGNFAGLPANEHATIKGTSGILLTLSLCAENELKPGSSYRVSVTNCTFAQRVDGVTKDIPIDDFSFTITIGEPNDGRLKFYETSTTLPTYTAGEKANVTMYRTIKANEWSTICLPFTLPKAKAEAVFGSDVEIYKYKDYTATIEDPDVDVTPTAIQINFTRHELNTSLSSIAGGTPYLIKTSRDIDCIEVDDVKLVSAVKNVSGGDTEYGDVLDGLFKGTFVKTTIPADGLFISENSFWYSVGKTNIKAFRAWFELDAVLNKEVELSRIVFGFDDTTTGITTNNDNFSGNDNTYDLQGRRVGKPAKGLYIKNGRKEVVK